MRFKCKYLQWKFLSKKGRIRETAESEWEIETPREVDRDLKCCVCSECTSCNPEQVIYRVKQNTATSMCSPQRVEWCGKWNSHSITTASQKLLYRPDANFRNSCLLKCTKNKFVINVLLCLRVSSASHCNSIRFDYKLCTNVLAFSSGGNRWWFLFPAKLTHSSRSIILLCMQCGG